jgi:hypothetical protein
MIVTKGKQLEEDKLTVKIIAGACPAFELNGAMKAQTISEAHQKGTIGVIENYTAMVDRLTHQSNFCIKFVTGSRKVPVALRFAQTINWQSQSFVIESEVSNPFVIITNEVQWEGSSGAILKKQLFGLRGEVSWPAFVNGLQSHFIWLTRQDPTKPNRTLSEYDFNYLHNKFFSRQANVSLYDFEAFWNWFGKSMQVLRYGRHCNSLWQTG